jgi:hypothetical protein
MSKATVWTGRVISGLIALPMLAGGVINVIQVPQFVEQSAQMGFSAQTVFWLGVTVLVCTILYVLPVTNVLGAILLTGYFGGAIATHVRDGGPVSSMVIASVFGVLVWLGLFLRDTAVRKLVPLRQA